MKKVGTLSVDDMDALLKAGNVFQFVAGTVNKILYTVSIDRHWQHLEGMANYSLAISLVPYGEDAYEEHYESLQSLIIHEPFDLNTFEVVPFSERKEGWKL